MRIEINVRIMLLYIYISIDPNKLYDDISMTWCI